MTSPPWVILEILESAINWPLRAFSQVFERIARGWQELVVWHVRRRQLGGGDRRKREYLGVWEIRFRSMGAVGGGRFSKLMGAGGDGRLTGAREDGKFRKLGS